MVASSSLFCAVVRINRNSFSAIPLRLNGLPISARLPAGSPSESICLALNTYFRVFGSYSIAIAARWFLNGNTFVAESSSMSFAIANNGSTTSRLVRTANTGYCAPNSARTSSKDSETSGNVPPLWLLLKRCQ